MPDSHLQSGGRDCPRREALRIAAKRSVRGKCVAGGPFGADQSQRHSTTFAQVRGILPASANNGH